MINFSKLLFFNFDKSVWKILGKEDLMLDYVTDYWNTSESEAL